MAPQITSGSCPAPRKQRDRFVQRAGDLSQVMVIRVNRGSGSVVKPLDPARRESSASSVADFGRTSAVWMSFLALQSAVSVMEYPVS
jgi:hypothetical protein